MKKSFFFHPIDLGEVIQRTFCVQRFVSGYWMIPFLHDCFPLISTLVASGKPHPTLTSTVVALFFHLKMNESFIFQRLCHMLCTHHKNFNFRGKV